jgi:hypothetical protein
VNYHNEFDPFAADWLEQLIEEGHIAPGVVDRRDIRDVGFPAAWGSCADTAMQSRPKWPKSLSKPVLTPSPNNAYFFIQTLRRRRKPMAKFTLMVETEDPAEIADITVAIRDNAPGEKVTAAPAGEAQTRTRRTKAQIEADAKAAAQPAIEEVETVKGITAEDLMDGDDKPITFEEVKAAMLDVVERKDAAVAKAVMVAHGVTGKLGEAPKELYPKLLAAFQAA